MNEEKISPLSSPAEHSLTKREVPGSVPGAGSGVWHYVVLRKELGGGALLAQAVHAAGESASKWSQNRQRILPLDTRACVLSATKEQIFTAITLLEAISGLGAPFVLARIDETDGPLAGSTTAFGVVTTDRDFLKPILGHLKPWRDRP